MSPHPYGRRFSRTFGSVSCSPRRGAGDRGGTGHALWTLADRAEAHSSRTFVAAHVGCVDPYQSPRLGDHHSRSPGRRNLGPLWADVESAGLAIDGRNPTWTVPDASWSDCRDRTLLHTGFRRMGRRT